jgi:zinc protease
VVAGRIDRTVVQRALAKQFAPIARRARGERTKTTLQPMTGAVRELRGDTDEPTAMVIVPAAPWGSANAFNDGLVDGLLMAALAQLEQDTPWITDVGTGHLGGAQNGVRYFAVSVTQAARLDDAIEAVFRTMRELSAPTSGLKLGMLAARRRNQLFDGFESIDDRGEHCANYLQRTTDREFHLRELVALEAIDTDKLSVRAAHLTRRRSHVLRILPSKDVQRAALPQLHAVGAVDAVDSPGWQAPVDPAEADRPVALPAERRAIAVTERRLANGLRLVMANDFTQPVVEARLVFSVGERSAGRDRAAIAHAAAMMLEHGTHQRLTFGDYTTVGWVMRLGAQLSAEVDDHTTFTVRGPSTFADWHLWRLHWLLDAGEYDPTSVAQLRKAAKRHPTHHDRNRGWRRALREAMFGPDPAGRDLQALIAKLQVDDLEAFRLAHYRMSDATLIIVGKFDIGTMARTVDELFGAWGATPPPRVAPAPARRRPEGPAWLTYADPEASQVRITASFPAASDPAAARGARAVVGAMVRERVAQIRTRLGASYGVQAAYGATAAGEMIVIDGMVDAGRAGEVLRRMRADLEGLHTGDAAIAADFVRARRTALAQALGDPMKVSGVADELEAAVAHHRPIDDAATLPAAIARTTLADARAVIAADLAPARMVVLLSGRPADTAAAMRAANITTYRAIDDGPNGPQTPARQR